MCLLHSFPLYSIRAAADGLWEAGRGGTPQSQQQSDLVCVVRACDPSYRQEEEKKKARDRNVGSIHFFLYIIFSLSIFLSMR